MATWQLQTAKAQLSELLRKAREEGPQTITVRGKEEYVVTVKEPAVTATPRTWDELSALAQGAGDALILPPREPEPLRHFELEEIYAEWQSQADEEG
ncbi:MAG TPA: type II toxin-antitoxin system prevent-host-death family antitoxin [Vitreimonas sp.]|jgi:prevent-host-death family protein|nr:type II toxin-antitoxin system prevent-host-death family antitoxin [Vitreimonas sp.]